MDAQKLILGLGFLATFGCEPKQFEMKVPVTDLGHIDLVLDSIDFFTIVNDKFLTEEFGLYSRDTAHYGSEASYDLYLTGQQNFFHISLAKGFWQDKEGSGILVFQTRKPDMKDSLLNTWKHFFPDSILFHEYKGSDFELSELMVYRSKEEKPKKQAVFFSNLTSYSQQSLKNWGFSDSSITYGITMREFMEDWDPLNAEKLFKKISRLHVQVTDLEFKDLESALRTVGYTEYENSFKHNFNPEVVFEIVSESKTSKFKQIEIELSRPSIDRDIQIGNSYQIIVRGTKMTWLAN